MQKIYFSLLLIFLSGSLFGQQSGYFENPVIKGDMADPSIIRIDDTYYATGTSSEWAPHYPYYKSKDLVNWEQIGYIFDEKPEWTINSFWAPELYYHNGRVFCYYTARKKANGVSYIGVASADSPLGKFIDHGPIIEYGTEAIDAYVYNDNGQLYISWKAYGLDHRPIEILASKLSDDGLRLEGEPFSLLKDEEGIGMEGQYHFKQGDYYYIVYAAHGCCGRGSDYDVYVARSKEFKGPYEKYSGNPILHGAGVEYISSGHGTGVITPDNRHFFMCHAYLQGAGFYAGRQAILQEMFVNKDNWVEFKTGNITRVKQPMPFDNTVQKKISTFEDNFKSSSIKKEWTWNFSYSDIKVSTNKGSLLLSGKAKEGVESGTAFCLRPQSPHYTYETRVTNQNQSFKGLTMYGDDARLVAWGIQGKKILLKEVKDKKESILYESTIDHKNPYFKIEVTNGCMLRFYYSTDGKKWISVMDAPFDGGYILPWDRVARPGLIHMGKEDKPARFSYFKLANID